MTSINNGSTALYRAGYTFSLVYANNSYFGWTGTTVPDFGNVSVIDVYTHYDIITYSITYTLNGATTNNNPTTYTVATAQTALNNPVKSGYTFAAWEDSNGNIVEHIGGGMTGNIALVACWYQDYALEYHSTLQYKTLVVGMLGLITTTPPTST
jgi:Listeria/Bacterioides repeat